MKRYKTPAAHSQDFTCPTCHVHSHQRWSQLMINLPGIQGNGTIFPDGYAVARCDACRALSIWHNDILAYPLLASISEPSQDMPDVVKADFLEAAGVFNRSPRASCALLRLALQRLCIELGLPGDNLNADIGVLVSRGLPEQIRKALDIVRFIGNEQVHPGLIDVRDDTQIAASLFGLLNLITEYMLTNPKRIEELHNLMPSTVKAQIEKRDSPPKLGGH